MVVRKHWRVEIDISEQDDSTTRAEALLGDRKDVGLRGVGYARRNPTDSNIPEIGDELAVSRALSDLAHGLLDATAQDIQEVTHRPAHLAR